MRARRLFKLIKLFVILLSLSVKVPYTRVQANLGSL